ncbi:MAG TPA: thioredoxin domain-containing protein [Patescibacteria group bacterium]|nr:thioredoxin domain-containing protein [Patescibacteria group bacterium]
MEKVTKKEKREIRKQEWEEKVNKEKKNNMLKKIGIWAGAIIVFSLVVWGLIAATDKPISETTTLNNLPSPKETDITIGSSSAKVILTEFADFQCPACADNYPAVKQVLATYGEKILFVYRNFPLPQHQNAKPAAYTGYAAFRQGKFYEMEDLLYENQKVWENETNPQAIFKSYAEKIGLDMRKYDQDVASKEVKQIIEDQTNEAQSLGINSTPTFFVNNEKVDISKGYDSFKEAIENALSKK